MTRFGAKRRSVYAVLAALGVAALTRQATAQAILSAGSVNGQAGQTAAVPITISVGSAQVVNLLAAFRVVAQDGAPAITDKLTYAPTSPLPNPGLVDNTSMTGFVAIGYVSNIDPPLTGTVVIGTVMTPIPAGATGGSYQVQVNNVSALDPDGNDVSITGQSGTIKLVAGPTPTKTPTPTLTKTPTPTPTPCVGACHGGSIVTVDELLAMVNIALGTVPVSSCEAGDANHDGRVTIDEILAAVSNALSGCGMMPPPLTTFTATPQSVHLDVETATGAAGGTVQIPVTI